jgi:hypothetical protein
MCRRLPCSYCEKRAATWELQGTAGNSAAGPDQEEFE